MHGTNPKRPPIKAHDGQALDVAAIFHTIQGEGPLAGQPATFIRLGGCNLACDFCDAEFEDYQQMSVEELPGKVEHSLVVITGGEPLRQNIGPLCEALLAAGRRVQIETNGTLYQELPKEVMVVCSPKNTGSGYAPLRPDVLARVDALKFIISKTHPDYQDMPDWCKLSDKVLPPIYLQPMDEADEAKNQANRQHAAELTMRYGVHLSLQLQKILGIA